MSSIKKSEPIGRVFTGTGKITAPNSAAGTGYSSKVFKLESGKKTRFKVVKIKHEEIESKTEVKFEINGRWQEELTKQSVSSLSTIKDHQFFPAIAIKSENGKLNILDGSRRRMAAIFYGADLEVMVAEDEISVSDAKKLAKDIQTAKEHNLRDIGKRLERIKVKTGFDNKTLAEKEGLSAAKVGRALRAAMVHQELINFFDTSELTYPDYQFLLDVEEKLKAVSNPVDSWCVNLFIELEERFEGINVLHGEIKKEEMLKIIKDGIPEKKTPPKPKVTTKVLKKLSKDSFIKSKSKGRKVVIEFNRIPGELMSKLYKEIKDYEPAEKGGEEGQGD